MSENPQSEHGRTEGAPADRVARLVHYSGRVQGVGFRATVVAIAGGYRVTGRVRNLPDGRVQLLAEGTEAEVTRFLDAVRSRWGRYIESEEIEKRDATGRLSDFRIVR